MNQFINSVYMNFRIKRRLFQSQKSLSKFCARNWLNSIEHFQTEKFKSSETLAILGSGQSINELDENDWDFIKSKDSLGFNNWIIHPFIPTYYFFEPSGDLEKYNSQNATYYSNICSRGESYESTPMIISYQAKRYYDLDSLANSGWLPRTYFQSPVNLPGDTKKEFASAVLASSKLGCYENLSDSVYRRGSLARIIHFAVSCGYKNIVLFGVDLNSSPYFFESVKFKPAHNTKLPDLSVYKKPGDLHMTVNPDIHPLTMFDVLEVLQDEVLNPNNIKIFNGSKSSALKAKLPFYEDMNS